MTIDRETVIRLAREADGEECTGWRDNGDPERYYEFWPEQLERFAALVLEHGRKPLTDEQIRAIYDLPELAGSYFPAMRKIVRAIEAAHGITNKESSDAE